jgi:hypothetical protein
MHVNGPKSIAALSRLLKPRASSLASMARDYIARPKAFAGARSAPPAARLLRRDVAAGGEESAAIE